MGFPTVHGQATGFYIPLTLRRNCPICRQRKPLSNLREIVMSTPNTFEHAMVTSSENTKDPFSSFQGSSSDLISFGIPFTDEERREVIRYLMNHAN